MVAADHHRCRQLAAADHFVERQAQLGALTQTDPADTRGQALKTDALAGHVQPVMQVIVVRDQLFDLGVGLVDVLRITRQRGPAERPDATAEQRADVGRNETGEVEGIGDADFFGHLANVVAVVEGRNAGLLERQHGFDVLGHRLLGGLDHFGRLAHRTGAVLVPGPAFGQVAVKRIVGAGLVGDHVRAHAATDHFRQNVCCVATQSDGNGFALGGVFGDACQCVVQIRRLFVDIAGLDAEIDAALLAFDVQRAGPGQCRGQRLCATHAAQACGQHPATFEVAVIVLATGFDEGFVGALNDALAADVDPAAGGHLAIHRQALGIQFVEMLPTGPVRHQVGVGDQHARGVAVGLEHADRLAGLHQQGFIIVELGEALDDLVVALPVARRATDATVNHQFIGVLGDFRVEVVHQHAQRRFGHPALGRQLSAASSPHDAFAVAGPVLLQVLIILGHKKILSDQSQPALWRASSAWRSRLVQSDRRQRV
ncbi:hypothetical protein ALP30_01526 [Pseudomonas syringae pv. primulae]|nr:hypothetical protein ALP30_01526 [Pseudomonas syringae pv. primulae]